MPLLRNGSKFRDIGTVLYLIITGPYYELYCLESPTGEKLLLKMFLPRRMPHELFGDESMVREAAILESLRKSPAVGYISNSIYAKRGEMYPYFVRKYLTGKTVAECVENNIHISIDNAIRIFKTLCETLMDIHDNGYLHNNICPDNVILSTESEQMEVLLTGFSHASEPCDGILPFSMEGISTAYQATETFWKTFSTASDIFSLGAVMYTMIYERQPWTYVMPDSDSLDYEKKVRTTINMARRKAIDFSQRDDVPQWLQRILKKCLDNKKELRFESIHELYVVLNEGEKNPTSASTEPLTKSTISDISTKAIEEVDPNLEVPDGERRHGNGFSDVAGLDQLKEMLQTKVLFLLKNKELAERYKLTPPNGMLLYGPPGCGKTYFAEKFAEESGYNFHFIKSSDIGSIYIHGSQGKIAELFKKAEKNAPSIICFDEFDAMAPNRDNIASNNPSMSGEVNEFLSQLNNCSERGLFIIGTTNKPDLIDQAVLRKGRIDLQIFVPAPDREARKAMFDLYLKDRPCDEINTYQLADMTSSYAGSDIAYIVNDAAMTAALAGELIKQSTIEQAIRNNPPSLTDSTMRYYKKMKDHFERRSTNRPTIGFH